MSHEMNESPEVNVFTHGDADTGYVEGSDPALEQDASNWKTEVEDVFDKVNWELTGWFLSGKITGKVCGLAMGVARKRRFEVPSDEDSIAIDEYNDWAAELDEAEMSALQHSEQGYSRPDTIEEALDKWLYVDSVMRSRLAGANIQARPYSDTLKFFVKSAAEMPSEQELAALAAQSGISRTNVMGIYVKKVQRKVAETKEDALSAIQIISEFREHAEVSEAPEGFRELVLDAINKSKASAIQRSNTTEDAFTNLILLKASEDAI